MPVRAEHAPTVKFPIGQLMFAGGVVTHSLDTLPRRAVDWRIGEQLSYVIDALMPHDTTPVFRIYYEDAPNRPPMGRPPRTLVDGHGIDVAVLCAATADNVPDTPGSILDYLSPAYVMITHWEDFFRPQTLPIRLNPSTDTDAFIVALTQHLPATNGWSMPLPRTTLRFAPSDDARRR